MKSRISGKEAVYVARESERRRPVKLLAADGVESTSVASVPPEAGEQSRKAPPRVAKPSAHHDQCVAPTPDLESHRKRLREAFGNTMSDEFVDVLLGKLVEALRPAPLETLDEATVNAAMAIIHSMHPRTELEALLAVQIIAAGFSGLRLLRQSQQEQGAECTVGQKAQVVAVFSRRHPRGLPLQGLDPKVSADEVLVIPRP